MKICKELILYFKEAIKKSIVITIIGTLLHFLYEITDNNIIVAMFSAVNESVWEHIKIAVFAIYIVALAKMWLEEKREKNLWSSLLAKVLTVIILIPTLFYTYKGIIGYEIMWIDILIFVISVYIAQIIEIIVKRKLVISKKIEDICVYINLGIMFIFMIFTFIQPKLGIFLDESKNKFGI